MFTFIPIPTMNTLTELSIHQKLEVVGALAIAFIGLIVIAKITEYIAKQISKIKIK